MIGAILSSTLLSSVLLIIQTTWLKNGLFWGVIPDFCLLVIVWVAYRNRDSQGAITGFLAGIVCDLLSSSPLGYFSFLYIVPAYAATMLRQVLTMDPFFIPVLVGFGATVLKGFSSIILLILFGAEHINAYSLSDYHFWIEAALNGAAAPLLFLLLNRMKKFLITKRVTG